MTLAIFLFQMVGCDHNPVSPPGETSWHPLGLFSDAFNSAFIQGDTLYVAAGAFGVYRRTPVRDGDWDDLGFSFPSMIFDCPDCGASVLRTTGHELIIGFRAISNFPLVVRMDLDSASLWEASDSGMRPGRVYDIMSVGDDQLIAANSRSFYLSSDNGHTWSEVFSWITESLAFSAVAQRIYAGGSRSGPFLAYSDNLGAQWTRIPLSLKMVPEPRAVQSVASAAGSELLAATDTGLFWSSDSGASFVHLVSTTAPATVVTNPLQPAEALLVADSVYYSTTGFRDSWTSFALPGRQLGAPGSSAINWQGRYAIIPVLEHDTGQLYLFDLPGDP